MTSSSSSGVNDNLKGPDIFGLPSTGTAPADAQGTQQTETKKTLLGDLGAISYEATDTISQGKIVFGTLDFSVDGKVYSGDISSPKLIQPDQSKINAPASDTVDNVAISTDPQAVTSQMLDNITQMLGDLQTAATTVQGDLPTDNSGRVATQDFLKAIGDAIQQLKEILRQYQITDSTTSKKTTQAKFDALQNRADQNKAMDKANEDLRQKQEKMRQTSLAMKIVGPILAAIATIVSTVLAVVTFGAAAPLIAASVLIGVAMVAYSVADSVTNVTSKAIDGFNKWVNSMVTVPPHTEAEQKAVKFAIVAAMAIVLAGVIAITVVAGGGGSVAANVAEQAVTQTMKQAILQGVKQLAIQMLIMVVMSSNSVPELIVSILKEANVSKEGQQAAQIITMVIMMLIMMLAMGKAGGNSQGSIGDFFKGVGSSVKSTVDAATQGVKNAIDRGIQETAQIMAQQIMDSIRETIQNIMNMIKNLTKLPKDILDNIEETFKLVTKDQGPLRLLTSVAQASPSLANAIGGAIQGSLLLQVSEILKKQGEIQASEDLLKLMIDLMQKSIDNLQGSIDSTATDVQQLSQDFSQLYQSASNSLDRLTQSTVLSQGA